MVLDEIYVALTLYRQRKYDKCVDLCNKLMLSTMHQKMAWELKMRAVTQRVYIDDIEADDGVEVNDDIEEARPETVKPLGSALRTTAHNKSAMNRPRTSTGRPLTGMSRPGTMSQRPGSTMNSRNALRTRTGTARNIRLGSASLFAFADPSGPLLQLSQFNPKVYAQKPSAGVVFKYLYYHEGDLQKARDLCRAVIDHRAHRYSADLYWWQQQLGRCHIAMGHAKEAEQLLRISMTISAHPDTALLLARVYIKLDQPEAALEVCRSVLGNTKFAGDISIMTQHARILELMGNLTDSVKMYRQVGLVDAMNCEALCQIAVHHFYTNQPEMALLYYRRILIMGVHTCELFCNIGLCCLYSGQLDLVPSCFQRAIRLATSPEQKADVWYNFSFVGLNTGDYKLAKRSLRLCVAVDGSHGAALNNLAILSRRGQKAKTYLMAAKSALPKNEDIQFNYNKLISGQGA